MAFDLNITLGKWQLFSRRHHDLRAHHIDTRHPFRHRVFNLDTGVHFNKVKLTVFKQKLKRTCAPVANFFNRCHAALANAFDKLAGNTRRWRFFNDFLMPALHRAITLTQPDRILVLVSHDLNFNMPGVLKKLLHVHLGVAKSGSGFGLGGLHGV